MMPHVTRVPSPTSRPPPPLDDFPAQPDDPLVDLELRIARRADELAAHSSGVPSPNLQCWLAAEAEILGRELASLSRAAVVSNAPVESLSPARA